MALLLLATSGCAVFGAGSGERSALVDAPTRDGAMTPARLELIFAEQVDAIEGPPGAIRTQIDGINVYLISDPERDRMRIAAPIALLERLDPRIVPVLLEANFQSTLDARYASSEGVVYAIFLHPISSLTPALIASALDQVVSLVKTFGSTFSSGAVKFGSPQSDGR